MEANCKGADQERVEGEECEICLKSVAMVGYVQEVGTVPPDVSIMSAKNLPNDMLKFLRGHYSATI